MASAIEKLAQSRSNAIQRLSHPSHSPARCLVEGHYFNGSAKLFHRQCGANLLNHVAAMTDATAPKLSKWPFFLADLLLLAVAWWIVGQSEHPLHGWPLALVAACAGGGAWACVTPFLVEYRAAMKFAESNSLTSVAEQIGQLKTFAQQVATATAQWQTVQEFSARSVATAKEISERMTAEAKSFSEFMQQANDSEKAHLRLEVDKLRRGEAEWLQVLVRLLDHTYALYLAGVRSGQPNVVDQLAHFQSACRDAARRIGLLPFEATPGDSFNDQSHQLIEADLKPAPGSRVAETLATGYTFQGQIIRCALVSVRGSEPEKLAAETPEPEPQLLFDDKG